MIRKMLSTLLFITTLIGCVSANNSKLEKLPANAFSVDIETDIISEVFKMVLTNNTDKSICIDAQDWPNDRGQLHFAADAIYAVVEGVRYPIKDRNLGYCLDGCSTVIAMHSAITGHIPFSEFQGNFEVLPNTKIKLIYSINPFSCPQHN